MCRRTGELPLSIGRLKANGCDVSLNGNKGFTLSTDISDVLNAKKLDYSNCCLTGELPKELGKLVNLTVFDISHNEIQGTCA
jgi:hypothetical protein